MVQRVKPTHDYGCDRFRGSGKTEIPLPRAQAVGRKEKRKEKERKIWGRRDWRSLGRKREREAHAENVADRNERLMDDGSRKSHNAG